MLLIEFIINLIESYLVFVLLSKKLSLPSKNASQKLGVLILAIMMTYLNYLNLNSAIQIICIWVLRLLYTWTCFYGNRMEKVFWGSMFMVVAFISEKISFSIGVLIKIEDLFVLLIPGKERYQFVTIYLFFCCLFTIALIKIKKLKFDLPLVYQICLLLFICSTLICADLLSDYMLLAYSKSLKGMVLLSDLLFFLIVFMLCTVVYLISELSYIYNERNKLVIAKQKEEYLRKEYEYTRRNDETMRSWRHDYRNHLLTLSGLIKNACYQKAQMYLRMLELDLEYNNAIVNSGDAILDVMLSAKIEEAKKYKIIFNYSIHLEELLKLNEQEITTLFGNLLDNAIEANINVPETERFINIVIKSVRADTYILCENRFDGKLNVVDNVIVSRKNEEFHGIGIKQIAKIIENVGGFYKWKVNQNIFSIEIILPLENR